MAAAAPITTQPPFTTRARFRAELRDLLESAIRATSIDIGTIVNDPEVATTIELPETVAGLSVVPRGPLLEALHAVMSGPLPPPAEREAEIRTNAVLNVWARCPNCGIHLVIPVEVEPQLTIGSGGTGELKVKAKSKGRIHACHQLTLDEPEGQLRAFAPDSMGTDVEDVSEDAPVATVDEVVDLLERMDLGGPGLDRASIEGWDQVTLELVADYARAWILQTPGVEIPDRPSVLGAPAPTDPDAPTPLKGRRSPSKAGGRAQAAARPAVTADDRVGELFCQGANHVPGHTAACPMFGQS